MKNIKHDHSLTKWLKGLIFAIMLFMPILIFLPNAFYYGFNETAVAQEKTEQIPVYYESNEVNTINDLVEGNVYRISKDDLFNFGTDSATILIDKYFNNTFNTQTSNGNVSYQTPYIFAINTTLAIRVNTNTSNNTIRLEGSGFIDFVFKQFIGNTLLVDYIEECPITTYFKEYQPLTTNMAITDSMSYAWKSVWQNDLFSWTDTTVIYTGINATTNGIGIPQQSYVASYLTYIFLLTIIYVIVDIILGIFTALTHIFNKEYK